MEYNDNVDDGFGVTRVSLVDGGPRSVGSLSSWWPKPRCPSFFMHRVSLPPLSDTGFLYLSRKTIFFMVINPRLLRSYFEKVLTMYSIFSALCHFLPVIQRGHKIFDHLYLYYLRLRYVKNFVLRLYSRVYLALVVLPYFSNFSKKKFIK